DVGGGGIHPEASADFRVRQRLGADARTMVGQPEDAAHRLVAPASGHDCQRAVYFAAAFQAQSQPRYPYHAGYTGALAAGGVARPGYGSVKAITDDRSRASG